jgi:nucleotide-binding universal stress UspA family protein
MPPYRSHRQELIVYRTILVPLDGSQFAEHALPTAIHLAAGARAPLLLVRVHQVPPRHLESTWDDFFRNEETAYLERIAARVTQAQSIEVETALLAGDVVEALRECADRRAESLIVMSTNGRTGLSRAWLGSVADGVLRQSTRPVLALRPRGPEHVPLASPVGNVLVALDGSAFAEQVVPHAVQLALLLPAPMTLFRVIEPVMPLMPEMGGAFDAVTIERVLEAAEQSARADLEATAEGIRREHPALEVRTAFRIAPAAAPAIIEQSCAGEGALVALATRGRGASRLVIGSVADKVIRAAGEGVLVIRSVANAA